MGPQLILIYVTDINNEFKNLFYICRRHRIIGRKQKAMSIRGSCVKFCYFRVDRLPTDAIFPWDRLWGLPRILWLSHGSASFTAQDISKFSFVHYSAKVTVCESHLPFGTIYRGLLYFVLSFRYCVTNSPHIINFLHLVAGSSLSTEGIVNQGMEIRWNTWLDF